MVINMTKIKLLQKFALGEIGTNILLDNKKIELPNDPLIPTHDNLPDDLLDEVPDEFLDTPDESFFIDEIEPDVNINTESLENIDDIPDYNDDYTDIDASEILHMEPNTIPDIIEPDIPHHDMTTDLSEDSHNPNTIYIPFTNPVQTHTSIKHGNTTADTKLQVTNISNPEPISVKIPIQPHTVNKTKPRDDNYDTYASNWIKEHGFDKDKNKAFIL